jgi:Mg2+-importing ATPase
MINGLTPWFSRFLRRRRALKRFGRHVLVDTIAVRGPTQGIPDHLAGGLLLVTRGAVPAAIARLGSHQDGLSGAEAATRLTRNGPNEVEHGKPLPGWLLTTLMKRFYIERFGWQ